MKFISYICTRFEGIELIEGIKRDRIPAWWSRELRLRKPEEISQFFWIEVKKWLTLMPQKILRGKPFPGENWDKEARKRGRREGLTMFFELMK